MTINQLPALVSNDGTVEFPVAFNNTDYKLPVGNLIMTKTVSGSTGSTGNITLGLGNDMVVLAVVRTGNTGSLCTPFYNISADEWGAHLTTTGASPSAVASTAVNLVVFYLPCAFEV